MNQQNPRFQYLNRDGIDALPDLQPMIGNVMDKGTVVALAAQPAAGKSFLAIDWACSYVTGRTWQDHDINNVVTYPGDRPQTGKVLYIAGEGGRGIKHRMRAWEQAWQQEVPKDAFILLEEPVQLGSNLDVAVLCEHLEKETYGLVVIDTIARCTLGLEENSATDMGKVIQALYTIRNAMGPDGTVLAIHHQGKSGTVRGSSALLGGVDQLLKLSRHGDTELILEDEKRKDNMELAPMNLTFATKFDSRVIESAGPGWTDRNELVTEMEGLRAVLPMSKTELRLATDLSEKQLFHDLARGLNAGLIKSDGAKNPRYSLSNEG